jgi:hypothetical protein
MDPSLTSALVAAIAALLVAVVSLVTALLGQRATAKATKELELLREARDQRGSNLEAIRQGIRSIQHAKDAIKTVLEAVPTSLDHERAALLLDTECSQRMTQCFQEQVPLLESDDCSVLHDAKNIAASVAIRFHREAGHAALDTALPDGAVRRLRRARRELNQLQQALRDSLMSKAAG